MRRLKVCLRAFVKLSIFAFLVAIPLQAAELRDRGRVSDSTALAQSCDIQVSFGSACCGIDSETFEKMKSLIMRAPEVSEALTWSWGKEGERDLCLRTKDAAGATKLYQALSAMLPARGHEREPRSVTIRRKSMK